MLDPVNPDGLTPGASRDGVLTTRDGGRTWSAPSASFLATDVTSITVDPAAPQEIWAGTKPTGVYRSPDGGATWSQASEGLTDRAVYQVILDPGRALWAGTGNGAFKSTDAGAHWTRASNGITASEDIVNLAIDPANPRRRFAQARFLNFYRSEDSGANWIDVKAKFESQNLNGLFGLAIVPGSPERIFVGIDRWLWQSIDGGATFAKCCGTLPLTRIQALAFDRATNTLYAGTELEGVWKSGDGGATWSASNNGLGKANVQALIVDGGGTLYAATFRQGVYRSTNRGATWTRVGGEPPHPDAITLALDPSGPGRLLVGMSGGAVWRLEIGATP